MQVPARFTATTLGPLHQADRLSQRTGHHSADAGQQVRVLVLALVGIAQTFHRVDSIVEAIGPLVVQPLHDHDKVAVLAVAMHILRVRRKHCTAVDLRQERIVLLLLAQLLDKAHIGLVAVGFTDLVDHIAAAITVDHAKRTTANAALAQTFDDFQYRLLGSTHPITVPVLGLVVGLGNSDLLDFEHFASLVCVTVNTV